MRIGIIAIQHESNTFLPTPTTMAEFKADRFAIGTTVRDIFQNAHHEVGGFLAGLDEAGSDIEAVPLLATVAVPSGTITVDTEAELVRTMLEQLDAADELDGLLVAPHGAAVSESHADMDGYWLRVLRQHFGDDKPIICTLDLHANLSHEMINTCNATITYRSSPHLDQRERGIEAARLMVRTLLGEINPTQAAAFPPIAINIERQQTKDSPCRELYALADEMLHNPKVLSNSVILGFPYADVVELGSSCIVVTDNDASLAQQLVNQLADYLWQNRQDFVADLISIEQALIQAAAHKNQGATCLLDMGDNVGGGSAADGTYLAHALHENAGLNSFISLYDPESVKLAVRHGIGNTITLTMGGKTDDLHGPPLTAEVQVLGIYNGQFHEPSPRHGGRSDYDMGQTVIVHTNTGLTIQLTSLRIPPFSLGQLTSCGLDPSSFDVLVAKGVVAPVAAYESVCSQLIRVNTQGSTTADMLTLPYENRRRPLFPFEG